MKQRTFGPRQPRPPQLPGTLPRWGVPFVLLGSLSLALLGSCVGGEELRAKSPLQAQPEQAPANETGDTPPAGWKPAREQAWGEARRQRGTQNQFVELLGKTQAEVEEKLQTAVHRFFGIGNNEPAELTRDSGYRVYYELPQDP